MTDDATPSEPGADGQSAGESTPFEWAPPAWSPPADAPTEPSGGRPGGQPSWTPPAYGAPPAAPEPYAQPSYAQPGAPGYGGQVPAYGGQSPYPQPGYGGQPPYGQAGYGAPGPAGWGQGLPGQGDFVESPAAPRRSRAILVTAVATALVLAGAGVGIGFATTHSGNQHHINAIAKQSASANPTSPDGGSAPPTTTPSISPPPVAPNPTNTPAAKAGPLDAYVVKPSLVANGAIMLLGNGGRSVTDVATLDYCGLTYASDKLRDTRVQVEYGTTTLVASNEFVKYKPGGAAQALDELNKAFASCPSSYVYPNGGGTMTQVKPFDLSGAAGLEPGALGSAQFEADGNEWNVAIYQFKGDYFSGIYTYGPDKASDISLAKKLAVDAAKHLNEAAAGKPGTGGGAFAGSGGGQPGAQT